MPRDGFVNQNSNHSTNGTLLIYQSMPQEASDRLDARPSQALRE
jgi:hypothetical protein